MTQYSIMVVGIGKVDVDQCVGYPEGDLFYDLFDENGHCLNEGNPFWSLPSEQTVRDYLKKNFTS